MKVYEKIKEFNDAKHMTKEEIRNECYTLKYCPLDIEIEHGFIGDERFKKLCQRNKCDIKCLEEYLEMEVQGGKLCGEEIGQEKYQERNM